jgi:type I restriction enzyme S subunit
MRKMTPQQLKNSILQMAMQGKLVEQRPEEGTGEALYQEIQAEKKKLISKKIIRKEKSFTIVSSDEKPFDIPKTWKWVRFGDITYNRDSERIPLSVSERKKLTKTYDYYGASGVIDKVDKYLFDKTLLLIGEDGANLINRSTPIAFLAKGKYWVNNHAHVLDAHEKLNLSFLANYINSISLVKYITGTAQPKMNQARMNGIWVPLPPSKEQNRIVAKLEEIQPFLDRYEKAYNRLEAYNQKFPENLKKSILQYAIEGKLVEQRPEEGTGEALYQEIQAEKKKFIQAGKIKKSKKLPEITEDEIPFEIPENWKWVKLGNTINLLSGADLSSKDYNSSHNGIVYITGASCIENGKVIVNRWTNVPKNIAHKGDLLLTCKGTVGKTAILTDIEEAHVARQIMAITPINMNVKYINYFILSVVDKLKKSAKSMIPGINRASILNLLFPLPPLEEQKRIVEKIEELMPLVEKYGEDRKD